MIPPERPGGRHRNVDMREVADGITHLVRTGRRWRAIPHDVGADWHPCRPHLDRSRADGTRAASGAGAIAEPNLA